MKNERLKELKRTPEWIEQGSSNNYQFRWCFMTRMIVINHFSPFYSAAICEKLDEWGKSKSNRGKFGRILDFMILYKQDVKIERWTGEHLDAVEDMLKEVAPELFNQAFSMANGGHIMHTENVGVRNPLKIKTVKKWS